MQKKMKNPVRLAFKVCPFCGRSERYRMARARKWKQLFFVRSYSCRNCHSQYIRLFGFLSVLVEQGFRFFYIPASEVDSAFYPER